MTMNEPANHSETAIELYRLIADEHHEKHIAEIAKYSPGVSEAAITVELLAFKTIAVDVASYVTVPNAAERSALMGQLYGVMKQSLNEIDARLFETVQRKMAEYGQAVQESLKQSETAYAGQLGLFFEKRLLLKANPAGSAEQPVTTPEGLAVYAGSIFADTLLQSSEIMKKSIVRSPRTGGFTL